jgi:hypothetical protein
VPIAWDLPSPKNSDPEFARLLGEEFLPAAFILATGREGRDAPKTYLYMFIPSYIVVSDPLTLMDLSETKELTILTLFGCCPRM